MLTFSRSCLVVIFSFLGSLVTAENTAVQRHFATLTGSNNAVMTSDRFKQILSTLTERLHSIETCFNYDYFNNTGSEITMEGFVNVSRLITKFIADKNCSEGKNELITDVDPHRIVDSLRDIGYHGLHNNELCFNEFVIEKEAGAARTTSIVLYIYEGRCLLPNKEYFQNQYKSYIQDEHGIASRDGFRNFLSQLNIGEVQSHDNHADGHNHAGHENHGTEHGHEDHTEDHGHGHDHHGAENEHENHDHDTDSEHSNSTEHGHHEDHDHDTDSEHSTSTEHGHHEGHDHDTDSEHSNTTEHGHHEDHDHDTDSEHSNSTEHGHEEHDDDHDMEEHDSHSNSTVNQHSDHSNGTAAEVDDHDDEDEHEDEHDEDEHARSRRKRSSHDTSANPRCFTYLQLLDIYEIAGNISDTKAFELCPALIQQIRSAACNSTADDDHSTTQNYTEAMMYGYGTASVAIISLLALLGLLLFPILQSKTYNIIMQFFIGLAIGTLASDALIHIIPQVLGVHDHDSHAHDHGAGAAEEDMTFVWQMSVIFLGLYAVFALENFFKALKKSRTLTKQSTLPNDEIKTGANDRTYDRADSLTDEGISHPNMSSANGGNSRNSVSKDPPSASGSDDTFLTSNVICGNFTSTLITIFVGDILHNFADGVAIGVAFSSHWATGISTSIAILCHELPHELGDFVIYLRNGASKWKAIGLNAIAACVAFIGLYAGINMGNDEVVRNWLLCAIAGIFLYIALVQVMGVMMKEETHKPLTQFLIQNLGMLIGWVIMVLIALYEERIRITA